MAGDQDLYHGTLFWSVDYIRSADGEIFRGI